MALPACILKKPPPITAFSLPRPVVTVAFLVLRPRPIPATYTYHGCLLHVGLPPRAHRRARCLMAVALPHSNGSWLCWLPLPMKHTCLGSPCWKSTHPHLALGPR